jgi:hypothetical protein
MSWLTLRYIVDGEVRHHDVPRQASVELRGLEKVIALASFPAPRYPLTASWFVGISDSPRDAPLKVVPMGFLTTDVGDFIDAKVKLTITHLDGVEQAQAVGT